MQNEATETQSNPPQSPLTPQKPRFFALFANISLTKRSHGAHSHTPLRSYAHTPRPSHPRNTRPANSASPRQGIHPKLTRFTFHVSRFQSQLQIANPPLPFARCSASSPSSSSSFPVSPPTNLLPPSTSLQISASNFAATSATTSMPSPLTGSSAPPSTIRPCSTCSATATNNPIATSSPGLANSPANISRPELRSSASPTTRASAPTFKNSSTNSSPSRTPTAISAHSPKIPASPAKPPTVPPPGMRGATTTSCSACFCGTISPPTKKPSPAQRALVICSATNSSARKNASSTWAAVK